MTDPAIVPAIICIVVFGCFFIALIANSVFSPKFDAQFAHCYVRATRWVIGLLCFILWGGAILIAMAGVFKVVSYLIFG